MKLNMKNTMSVLMLLLTTGIASEAVMAADNSGTMNMPMSKPVMTAPKTPSVAYGKSLFGDPMLSGATTMKSCDSCHPSGKGLGKAWSNPNLAEQINKCIVGLMKGSPLAMDSVEMKSLILYIKTFKPASTGY
jgi:cytochrome c peroxidase